MAALMNKKGIELAMNFIVTIIIAITIFGFGLKFIHDLTEQAETLDDITFDDLDEQIGKLLCDSSDRICIPIDNKDIKKGKFSVFGVNIVNVLDAQQNFDIKTKPKARIKKNGVTEIDGLDKIRLKHRDIVSIGKKSEESIGIGIAVDKDAESGTYIIDVNVCFDDGDDITQPKPSDCPPISEDLYKLGKIYVEVP